MIDIKPNDITILSQVSNGFIPKILCDLCREQQKPILYVANDDKTAGRIAQNLGFFDKGIEVVNIPAWDCLPFDRASPNPEIMSARCAGLSKLVADNKSPQIIITTTNSLVQKIPPKHIFSGRVKKIKVGSNLPLQDLIKFLNDVAYNRTETVRETGEYSVRGGIVDIYPANSENPYRIDYWGDEIDTIKAFDGLSQKSLQAHDEFYLYPASEVILNDDTISNFRQNYREVFGARATNDFLYDSVSQGIPFQGFEHWLAFYYTNLETMFDYLGLDTVVVINDETQTAFNSRLDEITDYYISRKTIYEESKGDDNAIYRPVNGELTYLKKADLNKNLKNRTVVKIHSYNLPDEINETSPVIDIGVKRIVDFTTGRVKKESMVEQFIDRIKDSKKQTVVACESLGSKMRIKSLFESNEFVITEIDSFDNITDDNKVKLTVLPMEYGFSTDKIDVYSESDLFGEKVGVAKKRTKKSENFLRELSEIEVGDYVIHIHSGLGQYQGLENLDLNGARYDCLKIAYAGSDVLFVPAENMDTLSRFSGETGGIVLDKLGSSSWQARKAKAKERIGELAHKLIEVASKRKMKAGIKMPVPTGLYDEFVSNFSFVETEDQETAINDIINDLNSGMAVDRLVCGDVGFGKTEVALRAVFVAVMNGFQVAVVAPTTLLARQHYNVFADRFKNFPVNIKQMSRLVSQTNINKTKQGLEYGSVDIVIGTHGVFAKSTKYKNLGLLIVDEEQHFGVKQKETLKDLRENLHIISLSATPIPRTLQMSLTGVRDLSIIATPPVDRLAIRTFTTPYDGFVVKEAIMRERFRGGQVYYVVPRLSDLDGVFNTLKKLVPDMNIAIAHGSVPPKELDEIMTDFTDGKYDILLATNIIESGIDVSNANTMIIHRADMFGLSQLYQLRGRIGRGKVRAYCYLTTQTGKVLADNSRKRLDVMQTIDALGAGFNIASHDLDIRGAGNLLGDEQSGHIKEVGVELYQKMLEEAITKLSNEGTGEKGDDIEFIPSISIGISSYIPDSYIADLSERLNFYRRLSNVSEKSEYDELAVELVDRFGKMPEEVNNLLSIVELKILCRQIGIEKIVSTDKGLLLSFYKNKFEKPEKLIGYMQKSMGLVRIRPDHKLEITKIWKTDEDKIAGISKILNEIKGL